MRVTFVGTGDAFGSGGRYNSCLHLTDARRSWLLDCGASAFLALNRAGIDPAAISTVLVTHFHGDHFAGLPFLFLDGLYHTPRSQTLTIVGPPGIEARFMALMAATFPGYVERPRPFKLVFREIAPGATLAHDGATVTAFAMVHDDAVGPCLGYRIAVDGRVIAFSGDTRWTEAIVPLGAGADLFVCECYALAGPMHVHLTYEVLKARLPEIAARRVILTHMSDEMLAAGAEIAEERARDGLVVDLA
jgi:ribonuclease BN (tRNA processing enzyme)